MGASPRVEEDPLQQTLSNVWTSRTGYMSFQLEGKAKHPGCPAKGYASYILSAITVQFLVRVLRNLVVWNLAVT